MNLNDDLFKQEAHKLALNHDPYISRKPSKRMWRKIEWEIRELRNFVGELRENRSACSQPAEEWLLDHAEFIDEQALVVRYELTKTFFNRLPRLRKTGESRVFSICENFIDHTDGILNEDSFISYINDYQEVSVLSISEVWALPLFMRICLIRSLAKTMEAIRERREICAMVERLLAGIDSAHLTPDALKQALDEAGLEIPLSGPLTVHLIKHLREMADDIATVREWLTCKLENGPESLDRIVSFEYQLQAANQVLTGNIIGSLRKLSRWDWRETFEKISMVEQTLSKEQAGDYPLLDFSSRDSLRKKTERLARRLRVPENLIASQAVQLAAAEYEQACAGTDAGQPPRAAYAAYYLLDPDGVGKLRSALKMCSNPKALPETGLLRRATGAYFNMLAVSFITALAGLAIWIGSGVSLSPLEWVVILLVLLFPAMEWAVTAAHWLIERVKNPVPLLRYDFSQGVSREAATMVVIPVIWSTVEEVQEMTERLEMHYLANRDSNIHFAILADFNDADAERLPEDAVVLEAAKAGIQNLNQTYPGSTFHLYQRRRLWNPSEGVWMGWERKRGKLVEFVELLKGAVDSSYDTMEGDPLILSHIRYIITLDGDTQLPMGSAQRMIGTLHLPYNRPRLNGTKTRVTEGYGVLQPRIGVSHEASMRSRLAYLWSADPGIDPYAFAVSDPYQDGLEQGIFTGKGIFDVNAFYQVLCERIPENRVLSHDLLEGGFLRAGMLSDIELVDEFPARFASQQQRQHRWIRGDWQLLLWLLPRAHNRRGQLVPVHLSVLTRWQIIDNLRRSLMPPLLVAILFLGLTVLPGSAVRWMVLVLATLFLPVIRQLAVFENLFRKTQKLAITAGQAFFTVMMLPYQSIVAVDAIAKTLFRLCISKRHLLEWVSSAEVERRFGRGKSPALLHMYGGYALVLLFIAAAALSGDALSQAIGISLGAFWACAPFIVRWLDKPIGRIEQQFDEEEAEELRKLSQSIWTFFEKYVAKEDNWLPPDNVQMEPDNGIAHRTSPTNIGLYLSCVLAARDFEFIDTPGLIGRLERTLDTVERMDKWEGHLYNWYDTMTLKPLPPLYVSTVDSGNFVGCLMTVKEGLVEWIKAYDLSNQPSDPDRSSQALPGELSVAFAEEITTAASDNVPTRIGDEAWPERGKRLIARMEKLITGTDFLPLYDHKSKLFALGYHAGQHERDQVLYDLMASEARQASFIAIALGQVSVSHWNALGRTMTKAAGRPTLLSWSGTMFEYLMPWLFMRTYRKTIWESTYRAVVDRQIEYAKQRGVPFGISESGYYAFDYQMNYQYRAFGVPGLGFKRGLEQDLVVAPYAAILALPFAKRQGFEALRQMEKMGARGKYGFYEAMDFTAERLPKDRPYMVIRSFMAHHQGMSMLALANLLLPRAMYERFHRDKRVRAAELLLQERIPSRPKIIKHPALNQVRAPIDQTKPDTALREYHSADTRSPEVCVLSNGTLTTVVTASGSGFNKYGDVAVTRWREDPVTDPWGSYIYIRDVAEERVWSPSYQPCRASSPKELIQFTLDKAVFVQEDDSFHTCMEICVSPEWNAEVRRLSLTNKNKETKILEVTTFLELAMAHPLADEAHPAFSKLFIRTEYEEEAGCLVAARRPREGKDKHIWTAHSLIPAGHTLGPAEYETDRARFIGRGHTLSQPQGLRSRLHGSAGSVADPAFVMRRRIKIEPGEQVKLFAVTTVAETKDEAVAIVRRFTSEQIVERTFQLAWNRGQIELRHLHMTAAEAKDFIMFAGQVLYMPPLRKEQENRISANTKGQSSLWSFGVSGDRPIVLARIDNRGHLPFIVKLLTGHEYLRRRGLAFDLVILNESAGGYHQHLQEALQRAAEHGVDRFGAGTAGVQVIPANRLSEEEITLLIASARIILQAGGSSFKSQIRLPRRKAALPPALVPTAPTGRFAASSAPKGQDDTRKWLFFNNWGGFSPDGEAYRILLKKGNHLPAPWINVLANPQFGCLVSELGTGYTWWRNSRECKLTPWSNDPVLDPPAEIGYLRDEESGEVWPVTPSTAHSEHPNEITHGKGFTRFCHERHGITHETTVFVPLEDSVKIIRVDLQNRTSEERRVSLTYYAEWVLGVKRQSNAPFIVTEWMESEQILTACNKFQETFRDATAFIGIYPQSPSGREPESSFDLSWTSDRSEFIGRNGAMERPAAMERVRLSGRTGPQYDSCGAVQVKLSLEPGEKRSVYILLGCGNSREAAVDLARRYSESAMCERALSDVSAFWKQTLNQITVSTPCPEMDIVLNGWLLYQSLACRMWARSAFYQAGGAYGFRDQLQDSLALLHARPDLTRAQILLHAAHQYEEGDVQHWWHEETERGIRTRFSDDLLWLPYSVSRYVEQTEDDSILDEPAPFLHSEPLHEGEHERYEPTQWSSEKGTIYEHCLRAIDRSLQRIGEHGLPLIGIGDWNDGMNLVGAEGRGESVWLGWFICEVLHRFQELCRQQGDSDRADAYQKKREQLAAALEEHAWDGQWYRRAFTDAGHWLGSIHNDECRIDAIAQSWSVISGAAPKNRALTAMQSFDRELVERSISVARLLTPPFDRTEPSPGYIQGYPPGIRENGAQYTHGVIWSIVAWCQLGQGDKAFDLFHMLNPLTHTRTAQEVRQYAGEPYVMAADVYTAEPHKGRAGWTWYTGAAGWMYQAGIEWILGIRLRGKRLMINPCIPCEWPEFTVTYRYGKTMYNMTVKNPSGKSSGVSRLQVDGNEVTLSEHDVEQGPYIEMRDDGLDHHLELIM